MLDLPELESVFPDTDPAAIKRFWAAYWGVFFLLLPRMVLRQIGITLHQAIGVLRDWKREVELIPGSLSLVYLNNLPSLLVTLVFSERFTLIRYKDVLIDPGPVFASKQLRPLLAALRGKITAILVTHSHEEHIGNAPLAAELLQVPIYSTALTLEALRQPYPLSLVWLSFITYASISHDLVHRSLGLPRVWNDLFLSLIELLTLHSGHAYQKAHLYHHQTYPDPSDVEGAAANMSWWNALSYGVLFQFRLWVWALTKDRRHFTLILSEGLLCLALVLTALLLHRQWPIFSAYVMIMLIGSWIIPFATSFVVHDPHGPDELHQIRLFRGKLFSILALEHLYHLYPGIPHYHWPRLAKSLDPYFESEQIKALRWPG